MVHGGYQEWLNSSEADGLAVGRHVARRDVFVSVMTLLDEQTIRTENVQYLSDSSISNHRR